jgi:hypothetical protein
MSTTRETSADQSHGRNGRARHDKLADYIRASDHFSPPKLASRRNEESLRKRLPRHAEPFLLWGVSELSSATESLIRLLDEIRNRPTESEPDDWTQYLAQWFDVPTRTVPPEEYALQCLAWAHALPVLASRLSNADWRRTLAQVASVVADAADESASSLTVWAGQLLRSELPLTLAYLFPELPARREWHVSGAAATDLGFNMLLDGAGMIHASHLAWQQPLLACWTRTLYLDQAFKKRRIQKETRRQFDWMVRETLRWTRPDAAVFFAPRQATAAATLRHQDLVHAALQLTGDETDRCIHKALTGGHQKRPAKRKLPDSSEQSEWAELAVLRSGWQRGSEAMAVCFADRSLRTELVANGQLLWSGRHMPILTVDGQLQQPTGDWQQTCWERDEDVAYLELEIEYGDRWRLQRQTLLGRKDGILLIADAVLGTEPGSIEYCQPLPLSSDVRLAIADGSNEAFMTNGERLGTILPLSLPEWRAATRQGELSAGPAELRQQAEGHSLYATLFVNLRPKRCQRNLTWRQLTVAENLRIVPAADAVAYRVQMGKEQWVFYRSLAPVGNRTFLGVNTVSEFWAARFGTSGTTEMLIDVVGSEEEE